MTYLIAVKSVQILVTYLEDKEKPLEFKFKIQTK
jgi:hypothetical protein